MELHTYINGVLRTDLTVRRITRSYLEPWAAELAYDGRHDAAGLPREWDRVVIEQAPEGPTTTTGVGGGQALFRGDVVERAPGGVSGEGVRLVARGRRFRLENESVRINGRSHYMWNRRGHECNNRSGPDSPGRDGGKWTVGEIAVDILEHALGIPAGGSAIAGHHGSDCSVVDAYLTTDDIVSYDPAEWLALDTVTGEFSVEDTPVAFALDMLVGLAGGFYGWYIDADGVLHLTDLDGCPALDVEAGETGHWHDEAGTDYRLLDNRLEWSLEGVASTVVVQGTDRTVEEKPADIEGSGNQCRGKCGELELVAAPWKDFPAAYRHVCQTRRLPTMREIDPDGDLTPPQGWVSFDHRPRIYRGTESGPKYVYEPDGGVFPTWNRVTGIICFYEEPQLDPGDPPLQEPEKLWGWYYARVPFTVSVGPDGDAYHHYGYTRTVTVYDPAFKHPTSWPQPGNPDDVEAMEVLARRLLAQRKDVRRQGTLVCDRVDPDRFDLDTRYSVLNLGPATSTTSGPTTSTLPPHPSRWDSLRINAVEVTYDFEGNVTEITVANTFFMLEGYSEIKRRLQQNLFARRELDLSEDWNDCQVQISAWRNEGEKATTTTPAPPSTTTSAGSTTTATEGPGPTTTTPVPCACLSCADLAAEEGGSTHANVKLTEKQCADFGYGCGEAADFYHLDYDPDLHGWSGLAETDHDWKMEVRCVPCQPSRPSTTTAGATSTTTPGPVVGDCHQVTIYHNDMPVYRTDPVCLACCDTGGIQDVVTAYGLYDESGLDCEGCEVEIYFTCTYPPPTSTTPPPSSSTTPPPSSSTTQTGGGSTTSTTTTAPGTTTTAGQCPSDPWCDANCPPTVYADQSTDCDPIYYPGCTGTYSWSREGCTYAYYGDGPCDGSDLRCTGGRWWFQMPGAEFQGGHCTYERPADADCPMGTYDLTDDACARGGCDNQVDVYS